MDSLTDAASVDVYIPTQYLPGGTPSANICPTDQELLQWQTDQRGDANQDWSLGSMDYSHDDFQDRMSGNFLSSGLDLE